MLVFPNIVLTVEFTFSETTLQLMTNKHFGFAGLKGCLQFLKYAAKSPRRRYIYEIINCFKDTKEFSMTYLYREHYLRLNLLVDW